MRISDWSSDVCSSDLFLAAQASGQAAIRPERDAKRQDSAAEARVRLLQLRQALGIFEAAERKAMEAAFTGANELPGAPGLPTKLSVKAEPAPATDPAAAQLTALNKYIEGLEEAEQLEASSADQKELQNALLQEQATLVDDRSEERRGGDEGVSTVRTRW